MHRFTLIFTALTIVLGARAAGAQQKPAAVPKSLQLESQPSKPPANEREVRRLVELVGVVEKELASIDVVMELLKKQMPSVPEKVWPEIRAEFVKNFTREKIIASYIPIYSGHFNATEIRQLIAFYSSPVGKKFVAVTPLIEMEAFLNGIERGKEMGGRLRELLKAKGYSVPST